MVRFCCFLFFLCFAQEEPKIVWKENHHLKWDDFKAKPQNRGSAVATTASGITFGFSIKERNGQVEDFTTQVQAHFYPDHSWYKIEQATPHILGHEQLHFDITELYARKFKQRIKELKPSRNIKRQLEQLHSAIQKELAMMQDQYDAETNFSRHKEAQHKWQFFINSELEKLSGLE